MFLGHSQRKTAICSRCHTVMYPGGSEDHKRGYCADGARQVKRKGGDDIPDWPRPQGIYVKGTDFHPVEFLKTLQDVYKKVSYIKGGAPISPWSARLFGKCFKGGRPSMRTVACSSGCMTEYIAIHSRQPCRAPQWSQAPSVSTACVTTDTHAGLDSDARVVHVVSSPTLKDLGCEYSPGLHIYR